MKNILPFLVLIIVIAVPGNAAQLPEGFAEEKIAEGLDPVSMAVAPDGRIFIGEKNGRVRIVKNNELLPDPFLEIEVDNFNERGLSGIALDPQFEQNNYFYVFYTVPGANHNRVSRFTANGDYVLPNSETVIFELDQLAGTIHNAGALQFGPGGKLYISTGDGADQSNGQDLNTTLGKILRINSDGSIPADNPFYNQLSGNSRAIWAYGFRNPFSMAIQPETGRIFTNDVGSNQFEEVNEVLRGKNYGWPTVEGFLAGQIPPEGYTDPVYAYGRSTGCSVVGAAFYNPATPQFPAQYLGKFFFADYCQGYIKVLNPGDGTITETFATSIDRPLQIIVAPDGALYYLERRGLGGGSMVDNTSTDNGVLWRVFYTGDGAPLISSQPASQLVPVGENATFTVSASGDQPLQYQWQKDGADIPDATEPVLIYPSVTIDDDGSLFRCLVSNETGQVWSEEALLTVTANQRPQPVILSPAVNTTYRAGTTISFNGSATDPEDGELSAGQLTWRIEFHHDDHSHPALAPTTGITSGTYDIPVVGETDHNVWYRIYLTATDGDGLSQTVYREIFPEKSMITINSQPAGLTVNVDGRTVTTPYSFPSVVGILRNIQAPPTQYLGDIFYGFSEWSTGSIGPLLEFQTSSTDESFTVTYQPVPIGDGTGLTGYYFNEFDHVFSGDPDLVRLDPEIDFDWAGGSPAPGTINEDFFSVRWRGEIQPLFSEEYTFYIISDDGVRLWIDDQMVINQWVPQATTETFGTITLEAGQRYRIWLNYFEDAGEAVARLMWSSPRTPKQIIPQSQLFPDPLTATHSFPAQNLHIQVYPQPARDVLNVLFPVETKMEGLLQLYDIHGRAVFNRRQVFQSPQTIVQVEVNQLPAGVYSLEVITPAGRTGKKVVIR